MCWAPLMLVGYLLSVNPWGNPTPHVSASFVEVQSCPVGLGFEAKASSAGFYGAGVQYGWQWTVDRMTIGLLPKAGLAYVDHEVYGLPLRTPFGVGGQALLGYDRWLAGVEYWHLSNAGLEQPNIGMDFIIAQLGVRF